MEVRFFKKIRTHLWNEDGQMTMFLSDDQAGYYGYDGNGERAYKLTGYTYKDNYNAGSDTARVYFNDAVLYVSPYFVVTPKGYTKHYYNGSQRLATKVVSGVPEWMADSKSGDLVKAKDYMTKIGDGDSVLRGLNVSMRYDSNMLAKSLTKNAIENGTYYYHGDHLGSASFITDGDGSPVEYISYLPYGELLHRKRFNVSNYVERYTFTGKERDEESGYYYFGARYFDATLLTSWLSVDPKAGKYPNMSPYLYCGGNPVNAIDMWGMDSVQRAAAVQRANEYVQQNPNRDKSMYLHGAKGGPGEKVDCSGLVSNCIVAAGEKDPNYGGAPNGVTNMVNNSVEMDVNDVESGNMVTFNTNGNKYSHCGIVTGVTKNDNGEVTQVDFIQSGSSTGPTKSVMYPNSNSDKGWHKTFTGFFKWDTYDAGQTKGVTVWGPPSKIPTPKISASPKVAPNVSMIRMPR